MQPAPESSPRPQPDPAAAAGQGAPASQATTASFPAIPGYRIEAVIGRGSAGTVYRAVQLAIDRKVALKVLHPELAARGRAVRRLQREARTTARLSHAGIVTAIDMGTSQGLWWYAMELVDGPSLAEKLKRDGALSERDAIKLFIPLCEALEHAFEHGVVHRDIKPGNILVDSGGRARLVDLGLAFAEDDPSLTMQGGTLGTPHYISPEQARNPKNADVRSDIWSLGATLYHSVCGRPPFSGASVAEILSGVLYAPVPDPVEFAPDLCKPLRLVIRKCLARDPERRYQHPRELREDLEAIRERRAVSVRRSMLEPVRGEKELRRRMTWIAVLAAAAAGVVALVALKPWAGDGSGRIESSPQPFEPLDEVAGLASSKGVAYALERLNKIAQSVPPEHDARAAQLRSSLEARLETALHALRSDLESETSRRLPQQDFVGMLAWIDETFPARLMNELGASRTQVETIGRQFDLAAKRAQVEQAMDVALFALHKRASEGYREQRVAGRSEPARAARKWRTARAALEISGAELIAEAGAPVAGFPQAELDTLATSLEDEVEKAIHALEQQWTFADNRSAFEIAQIREELLQALEDRRILDGTAELERRWREIAPYVEGEDLALGGASASVAALDKARAELAELESRFRAEDARSIFASLVDDLEPAWSERRYDRISEKLAEMLARPALEPVRAEIELLQAEAKLLEGVLTRAASRIEAAAASREVIELYVHKSLSRRGRVEEAHETFLRGFRFLPSDTPSPEPMRIALREPPDAQGRVTILSRAGVEQLAGLGLTEPPERGLETALFRWRSGEPQAALDLRAALRPPDDPALQRLYAELRQRLERDEHASRIATEERIAEATDFLRRIRRARQEPSATPREQEKWIDELTKRFGDLPVVVAAAGELQERRAELRAEIERTDLEHLRDVYGPTDLERPSPNQLEMRWVFDSSYRGKFQIQGWRAEDAGWIAPRARTRSDLESDRNWPILYLREGVDLTQDLDFELLFEQPDDSGDPELLALSVAGVHVVFIAPSHAGQKGRYLVGSGAPEDFRALLRDALERGKGSAFDGFTKGERYRIRLELRNGRGQVGVSINGRDLSRERESVNRPNAAGYGDKSVMIRSLEPVRVLEATLKARTP